MEVFLRRSQIIRNHDHRFVRFDACAAVPLQDPDDPLGDVLDICRSSAEILVIHLLKHFLEIISGLSDRKLCIYALSLNDAFHGFHKIIVIHHHLVCLKDLRRCLSDFLYSLLIQGLQLLYRFCAGLCIASDFCIHIFHFFTFHSLFVLFIDRKLSDGNPFKYRFSFINDHAAPSSFIISLMISTIVL